MLRQALRAPLGGLDAACRSGTCAVATTSSRCMVTGAAAGSADHVEIPALTYTQLPVQSLEHQRQKELPASATDTALKRAMLRLLGYYSRESTLMRGGEALLAAVVEASDSPAFQAAFQVPDTFQHRHSVLCMHVWLLLQRLRTEGDDGKDIGQSMYDGFQEEVERRARATGAKVRFSKYLKEYEMQFYGSSRAMDLAMEGKADLAGTLARNVYLMDPDKQAAAGLLARHVRREIACLAVTPSEALMNGNIRFSTECFVPAEVGAPSTDEATS